ncbi:MAG TPA: DUF4105 domain-containing protein [Candidatus Nanoarchaeia archaeon]|nr:DUF4105 domain-containing protein [Candidatus Nanoarchaeia archaeon]
MKKIDKKRKVRNNIPLIIITLSFILIFSLWAEVKPSNDRDWTEDQKVLQHFEGSANSSDMVTIYNIRNFTYYNTSTYYPSYYNKTYNTSELNSLWYIVEPFSEWQGSAHTFLSFGFNDSFLAVSVEIRKEKGEKFSIAKGLFKQYELMYVLGDEKDLVKLRSNYRNDSVFVYPVNASQESIQLLFKDVLSRVNSLAYKPEFYNTLTNTCTTNIARHVNNISPGRIPFALAILAPGYSDKYAYKLGMINTTLPYEQIREHYKINDLALKYANSSDFSLKIRGF